MCSSIVLAHFILTILLACKAANSIESEVSPQLGLTLFAFQPRMQVTRRFEAWFFQFHLKIFYSLHDNKSLMTIWPLFLRHPNLTLYKHFWGLAVVPACAWLALRWGEMLVQEGQSNRFWWCLSSWVFLLRSNTLLWEWIIKIYPIGTLLGSIFMFFCMLPKCCMIIIKVKVWHEHSGISLIEN